MRVRKYFLSSTIFVRRNLILIHFFIKKILSILSNTPVLRIFLKIFYSYSLSKLKRQLAAVEEIFDVILISEINSSHFIYGQSDYNILIIVKDHQHPKRILYKVRNIISHELSLSLTINTNFIPIITHKEYKLSIIKSYLLNFNSLRKISWSSLLYSKNYDINMSDLRQYPLIHNLVEDFIRNLYISKSEISLRRSIKKLFRALVTLANLYPTRFKISSALEQRIKITLRYPILAHSLINTIMRSLWKEISAPIELKPKHNQAIIEHKIHPDFVKELKQLLNKDYIDDIILTPSLIQMQDDVLSGKVFLNILFNQNISLKKNYRKIVTLNSHIQKFSSEDLKIKLRFNSSNFYQFQSEYFQYPYPLEPIIRQQLSQSLSGFDYLPEVQRQAFQLSCINFFVHQFMRFRSSAHKTDLIGSKFIKSLNLMYRYYLLLEYLKYNQVDVKTSEKEIRAVLTPQFSTIDLFDEVTDAQWKVIRAQLIYLLKKIRIELIKFDKELKAITF